MLEENEASRWPVDRPYPSREAVQSIVGYAAMILSGDAIIALRVLYSDQTLGLDISHARAVSGKRLGTAMGYPGRTVAVRALAEIVESDLVAHEVEHYGTSTRPAARIKVRLLSDLEISQLCRTEDWSIRP